jgi:hypothetical protein
MRDSDALGAARLITAYLAEHRDACDSLEGIARWWLPSGGAYRRAALVKATEELHAYGLLQEIHAADGHTRYRRPIGSHLDDAGYRALAEAFVTQHSNPPRH